MKQILTLFVCLILMQPDGQTQSRLGDVAVVYIYTPQKDSSISLYNKLGFNTVVSVENPRSWALLSDSSLYIMLRQDTSSLMGLCYYSKDPESIAAALEADGFTFTRKPKPGDLVRRFYLQSPDGFTILLTNNAGNFVKPSGTTLLNMPQSDFMKADKYPNKQCGVFGEYAIPVKDIEVSKAFWQKLGFTVKADMKTPYPHAILSDGLMIIGLHQTDHFNYPAVTYFGINTSKRTDALKQQGVSGIKPFQGPQNQVLNTFEGQHFFIFSLGM